MARWLYEIQVVGELDGDRLSQIRTEVGGVSMSPDPPGTVLLGIVPDQAALIGVLDRLQALGLDIRDVHRIAEPQHDPTDPPRGDDARAPGPDTPLP